jgi:hypothetical protein
MRALPTAPLAAAGLIGGYAVAVGTGSRALGGVVLSICGLCCIAVWAHRQGARTALTLAGIGLGAFAVSHVLALAVGAWPSVLLVAAAMAAACWMLADAKTLRGRNSVPGARRGERRERLDYA